MEIAAARPSSSKRVPSAAGSTWLRMLCTRVRHNTLDFLRHNGLDELVDGYGVHFYPSNPDPNTPLSERINGLKERTLVLCTSGKPCWLTERGFANRDLSCPIHDETRAKLIQTEREAFEMFVKQGRLAAIIYYNWTAKPGYEAQAIWISFILQ